MRTFSPLLVAGAVQASSDFRVSSCNDENANNAAAMTIQITEEYMLAHHNDHNDGTFNFNGTHYTKTIQGSALTPDFSDSDFIFLNHELVTAQVAIQDTTDVYFAGRTTTFKCKYPRAVNVNGNYTVTDDPDPSPYEHTGFLQYDFTTTVANGRTEVVIAAQHGITSLEANVENCAVTYANMPDDTIYPVRYQETWGDSDVCIDNRIGTTFTYANGGATIDWRTFHFNSGTDSTQQQQVTCAIHVSNTLTVSNPSNCDCNDRDECRAVVNEPADIAISRNNLLDQGINIPLLWKLKFDFFLDPNFSTSDTSDTVYNVMLVTRDNYESAFNVHAITCDDRFPGLWLDARTPGFLGLRYCVGSPRAYNLVPEKPNDWQSFEIGQREENGAIHFYTIVDGTEHVNMVNNNPITMSNMRLYAGEPLYGIASGRIRNIMLSDESVTYTY